MNSPLRGRLTNPYNIPYWSDGYIDVNSKGEVMIKPHRQQDHLQINLKELVETLRGQGLKTPVLIRFNEILHDRVNSLVNAFNEVCKQQDYQGRYTVVYPIKVNQQRRVVEEILRSEPAAGNLQVGLEAGSKPELMAVLALSRQAGSTIVCNGYKDREYIRLALIGRKLGHRIFIVVEKHSELPIILEEAEKLGVSPLIGLRARLSTIGKGNWQNTGGEKSKFGLSANQILQAVALLKEKNALDTLQLLHFHLGSQIANIRDIQTGLRECARFYSQLREMGAPVDVVDIGGGLGIDYEGTRSRSACSVNYSVAEYAYNVVQTFADECSQNNYPHPDIISESGRALTAHHAVLVADVVDVEQPDSGHLQEPSADAITPLKNLWRDYVSVRESTSPRSLIEIFHDAAHSIGEIHSMFAHGIVTLSERAQAEQLWLATCTLIRDNLSYENRTHRDIMDELNEKLADKLFVNFSLFQSLPDIWGIDQIFPILPLEGLNNPNRRRVVIQDITCDSDGRIDHYVDDFGIETTLPVPDYQADKPFMLGFFLTGAYQEILGDMHNLFGDTDSVDVAMNSDGSIRIEHPIKGDTVDKVLRYVNYNPDELMQAYRAQLDQRALSGEEKSTLLEAFVQGLQSYTYLQR